MVTFFLFHRTRGDTEIAVSMPEIKMPIKTSDDAAAACDAVAAGLRRNYPKAFKTMQDLCSCALAELRMFQSLVHAGVIQNATDYEEYISPPYACKTDDESDVLYEVWLCVECLPCLTPPATDYSSQTRSSSMKRWLQTWLQMTWQQIWEWILWGTASLRA